MVISITFWQQTHEKHYFFMFPVLQTKNYTMMHKTKFCYSYNNSNKTCQVQQNILLWVNDISINLCKNFFLFLKIIYEGFQVHLILLICTVILIIC